MLRGDPRKSVMPLALPVMVTMIFTTLYNVVDGIWIAGLGRSALAGVGIVTPLWMVVTGVSNGLAQGATSVISRYAASDKQKAEKAAEHAIMIFIAGALLLTVLLLGTLRPFLNVCSVSSEAALEAVRYSLPLFGGLLCFTLSCGLAGILRAEGDSKRPMYAITTGVVLNGLLDPVFIYWLGWGTAGAAVSTVVTSLLSALMMSYWIFVRRKAYLYIHLSRILQRRYDMSVVRDVLGTGLPASVELLMMSFASFMFYAIIPHIGGDHGIAVYTSGYRLYQITLMPVTSISLASVAIVGTHYGLGNMSDVRRTHTYCCLYAMLIAVAVTTLAVVFSHPLASLFGLATDDVQLIDDISRFIRITAFCIPFLAVGLPSTFLYLGLGRGKRSLLWTTINEVVCCIPATWLLGIVLGYGLSGVWFGFVLGRGVASVCDFLVARRFCNSLAVQEDVGRVQGNEVP